MMAGRRLNPEERAIWSRLVQTIRPLAGRTPPFVSAPEGRPAPLAAPMGSAEQGPIGSKKQGPARRETVRLAPSRPMPVAVLDDSWERRIATGSIIPEMSIDLHGHSLESAHKRLDQALGAALMRGVRVLLVVTGNPRPSAVMSPGQKARGAIRAEIGDWLALGSHADAIASVRTAHPRHGGRGALYIILRRRK